MYSAECYKKAKYFLLFPFTALSCLSIQISVNFAKMFVLFEYSLDNDH